MKNNDIYILGVGANTAVYIDLAESCGFRVAGLFHFNMERTGDMYFNTPIIDSNVNLFKKSSLKNMNFAVSVGDNFIRQDLSNQIRRKGGKIPTLIHPSSIISKNAEIMHGVVIQPNSVIQAGVKINMDSVISFNASVTHNSWIGKACYIANGAIIGASVKIFDMTLVGQGANILPGKNIEIGQNSVIGAGSVVTESTQPKTVVMGNPAKIFTKT